jgi:hypothetical protein
VKPTIGRIVVYVVPKLDYPNTNTNNATELPAVIVRVWSDTCVNLKVLNDGEVDIWRTSSTWGDQPGQWRWPERV